MRPTRLPGLLALLALQATTGNTVAQPTPPAGTVAYICPADSCEIRVHVDDCRSAGGIRLDRPLVEARDIANLRWTIVTPGYVFARPPLSVEAPDGEFEVQPGTAANELRALDRNSIMGDFVYGYTLAIEGCRPVRGWVRNLAI